MCGRYTIADADGIRRWLPPGWTAHIDPRNWFRARHNIAPSQEVPVVANDGAGLQPMRWGLVPFWAKDVKIGYKMINARCETLVDKPAFKKLLQWRRCLLPADGFYEWKLGADGKTKTPMYIHMKSGEPFAFAGLWDLWTDQQGNTLKSCTIITGPPNDLVASIHDRMPVILPREAWDQWLRPGELSAQDALKWMKPHPADTMEAYAVRPLVNSPKNDGPDLIEPAR